MASAFAPFSGQHFAALGVVLGCGVGLPCAVRRFARGRLEVGARVALAAACLAFEAAEVVSRVGSGMAELKEALPLHLCDLAVLIAPVALLTRRQLALELLYFWGIGGSLQALATPTLFSGFPALVCLAFFTGHALTLTCALYAVVVLGMRPRRWGAVRVWLITNAYAAVVFPLNLLLNTNYLFIMEKPATPSLLDLLGPWPWYLVPLEGVALVVLFLCYAPFVFLRPVAGSPTRQYGGGGEQK